MSRTQLERLYRRAYERMAREDGYQPYGYDWRTLRITKPGWVTALERILVAIKQL